MKKSGLAILASRSMLFLELLLLRDLQHWVPGKMSTEHRSGHYVGSSGWLR